MDFFVYFLLVFLTIFQDVNSFKALGGLGKTYIPFIVIIAFLYILIRYRSIETNKVINILKKLALYLFVVNIIVLFFYVVIFQNEIIILGESALVKTIKGYMYFFIILLFIVVIYNLIIRLDLKRVLIPFQITFIFLFFAGLFEVINPALFNKIFHSDLYNRMRLFTSESSYTGTIIVVYGMLGIYYCLNYSKKMIFIDLFMLFFFVIMSGSKGLGITLIISGIICSLISKIKFKYKFMILFIILLIGVLIIPYILESLKNDIQNYSSVSTRVYSILIATLIMFRYPFGVGNFVYLSIYPTELQKYLYLLINRGLNISEINSYIYATDDTAIAAKSGLFQYGMYWGIIGTIVFIIFIWKMYRILNYSNDKNKFILIYAFIFIVIAIFTYIDFDIKYEIWAFFIVSIYISNNKRKLGDSNDRY